ncbi:hypothetical protein ETB97_009023 [Aspergillus alliaceus]|uniref:Carrier domain-containing protein n=1 Tax=Petromyces alliaceus TaxID=209559 RepID=A0A8H6ABA7_PETAA|nr:hypothetical protein ETB97_009023 [Aspergillus burnettii]
MVARPDYRFPCLTDGVPVEDDALKWVSIDFEKHAVSIAREEEARTRLLSIAWSILLFVYDENESVSFGLLHSDRESWIRTEINHEVGWQDLQLRNEGAVDFEKINTGVCICDGKEIQIPEGVQLAALVDWSHCSLSLVYRSCLLSDGQATNVASTFDTILQAVQGPNTPIGLIDVLSERNVAHLSKFNVVPRAQQENCLHAILKTQARENGDRVAVDAWDGRLTYRELDMYSTSLATHLASMGVSRTFVPLCAEKSVWAVVAILAILKAGAACSPLEPSHPRDRLLSMVEACGARVVIATEKYAYLFQRDGVAVVIASSQVINLPFPQEAPPGLSAVPRSAAFLMWTSGSTGNPKGVVLEHAGLYMSITAYATASHFTAQTRTFQFTSFTFTVSLCDIFGTMSAGGCLCMPSDLQRLDDLAGALRDFRASFCWLTSTSLAGLEPDDVPDLKSVTVGGESLPRERVSKWARGCQLNVSYGTTETCGWCLINPALTPTSDSRILGKPIIPAAWISHPDSPDRLVPVGAVGELLIEGPFLAKGYLHDGERTAAQFIRNPKWMARFRPGEETRLYRTNDLVRHNSDGSISFVGRKQAHAKIRGNRINLNDVEHHVRRACGISEAVVDVIHTVDHVDLLTAFLLSSPERQPLDGSIIQRADESFRRVVGNALSALENSLPSYMIPSAFVPISRIPLTRTNKTDRRLLREQAESMSRAELVQLSTTGETLAKSPLSKKEHIMCSLWSDLTGVPVDSIGANENFFHVGGDSVLAIQLVPIARQHGLFLTVMDVFQHPTLRELVAYISEQAEEEPNSLLVTNFSMEDLKPEAARLCGVDVDDIEDMYPCTSLQEGLMALSAQRAGAYVLQLTYDIPPAVELDRFLKAWQTVVTALPILRTRIVQLGRHGFSQVVVKESLDWNTVNSEAEYRQSNMMNLMGLGSRLARFTLLQTDSRPTCLLLTAHHSIFDRWSTSLLLKMVDQAYRGQTVETQSFKSFVSYIYSRPVEEHDGFWKDRLSDVNHTEFPKPPQESYRPNPSRSTRKSITLSPSRSNFTATTKLRLSWALLLAQHTDNPDVVFGAVSTGRSAPVEGIESLVGPTLATVPFRVRVDPDSSVEDALQALQEDAASTLPHEQRGVQNIARLGPDAKRACKFENLLIVHAPNGNSKMTLMAEMKDEQLPELFSYGLTLSCEVLGSGLVDIQAFFDPIMIHCDYVETLLAQLAQVVQQVNEAPCCKLKDINFLSQRDKAFLRAWQTVHKPTDACVHEIIQKECSGHPEAEAVCSWDGSLSYAALDKLSSDLAARLHLHGVKPGVFVPLLFEKSKWTVVALLAVMKAGGAFVLLDSTFPEARLQSICGQIGAYTLLSSQRHSSLAKLLAPETIIVNADLDFIPSAGQLPVVHPDDPLYAIFTSGSTGTPKGVLIDHASYSAGARAHTIPASITSSARVLQFSSYAFDASIIEHLTTLMAGGCVCIISDLERTSSLADAVAERKANWTWLTPSVVRSLEPSDFPTLKNICLMGEPISRTEIEKWSHHVHLMQAYGPAECSVLATLQTTLTVASDQRNIGLPMGVNAWIVDRDDHTKLTPVGAIGELVLEGPIVGRGYLGNTEQTKAAFIDPPAWMKEYEGDAAHPGRVYKTGDIVQYAPQMDGSLRYISRKDTQVKIRGQRLELAEVESHARSAITWPWDIVIEVVSRGEHSALALFFTEQELYQGNCTMLSITSDQQVQLRHVRQIMEARLPSFMVPTVWIPLTRIPLSASKKTDRAQLRRLVEHLTPDQYKTYILVGTSGSQNQDVPKGSVHHGSNLSENEKALQSLIHYVLEGVKDLRQTRQFARDELFTDMGGDSLQALTLASLAKKDGFSFNAGDVLTYTLGELAIMRND